MRFCELCEYWSEDERPNRGLRKCEGLCRRHAPRPTVRTLQKHDDPERYVEWPRTCSDDGCGEYQLRKDLEVDNENEQGPAG